MKRLISIAALVAASGAWADDIPTFYRCGKVLSDRPMPECADAVMRERRIEAERTKKAAEDKKAAQRELSWWLWKYPNPAAVERERQEALQRLQRSIANYTARIARLEEERRYLLSACDECDRSKPMPQRLRSALDENEGTLSLYKQLTSGVPDALRNIDQQYALTLARMKELWKMAPIESLRASSP